MDEAVVRLESVVTDCADPERLASFYGELLGTEVARRLPGFIWLAPAGEGAYFARISTGPRPDTRQEPPSPRYVVSRPVHRQEPHRATRRELRRDPSDRELQLEHIRRPGRQRVRRCRRVIHETELRVRFGDLDPYDHLNHARAYDILRIGAVSRRSRRSVMGWIASRKTVSISCLSRSRPDSTVRPGCTT